MSATTSAAVIIKFYALYHGAPEQLALRIAWCESTLVATAKSPLSSAKGLFQFLDGTWAYYGKKHWKDYTTKDVKNPFHNADLATWVIANYGTNDWLESKPCWDG